MFNLTIKTPAGDFRSISSVSLEKLKEKIEKRKQIPYLAGALDFVLKVLSRRKSYLVGYQFDLSCFDSDKKYYEIHLDTGTGDF
jgi:hypothetical protein